MYVKILRGNEYKELRIIYYFVYLPNALWLNICAEPGFSLSMIDRVKTNFFLAAGLLKRLN